MPRISTTEQSNVAPVAGAIGALTYGVHLLRGASAPCCVGGNFSLNFDGAVALVLDLDNSNNTSAVHVQDALRAVIDQGKLPATCELRGTPCHTVAAQGFVRCLEDVRPSKRAQNCTTLCGLLVTLLLPTFPASSPNILTGAHRSCECTYVHPRRTAQTSQITWVLLRVCGVSPLLSDEWGTVTVDYKRLLDGAYLWLVTFNDYTSVARGGGAPLLDVSSDGITNGRVSVTRLLEATSPVVHRILLTAISELDSGGLFEISVAGVVTRSVPVDVSAGMLQNVSASFCGSSSILPGVAVLYCGPLARVDDTLASRNPRQRPLMCQATSSGSFEVLDMPSPRN